MEYEDLIEGLRVTARRSGLYSISSTTAPRATPEDSLWDALIKGKFEVNYQPIVRLDESPDNKRSPVVAAETSLHWRHSEETPDLKGEFLPDGCDDAMLVRAVEACALSVAARAASIAGIELAVRLSASRFYEGDELVLSIYRALQQASLHPLDLTLEISEPRLPYDMEAAVVAVEQLQALGVRVIADNFGLDFSPDYLEYLALDGVKLNAAFIRGAAAHREYRDALGELVDFVHGSCRTVTADGVESSEQSALARDLGCNFAQGNFYGRPDSHIASYTGVQ